ncbi:MAG: VOC family protein [Solirubrobacteraceae bacterium]
MEINDVAHIILRVSRFEQCVAFYDALMPRLGLEVVYRSDDYVYYVGGRTAVGLRRPTPELAGHAHEELAPGLDHFCFRARRREDIDELYLSLGELGAELVRPPGGRAVGTGLSLALVPRSRGDPLGGQPRSR